MTGNILFTLVKITCFLKVQSNLVYLKNYEQRQRKILRGQHATITSPVRLLNLPDEYYYVDLSKNKTKSDRIRRDAHPKLDHEEPLALKLDLNQGRRLVKILPDTKLKKCVKRQLLTFLSQRV